jgi:hypothetical protein
LPFCDEKKSWRAFTRQPVESHSTGTVRVMGKLEAAKVARSQTRSEAMEDGSGGVALAGTESRTTRKRQSIQHPLVGESLPAFFDCDLVQI